MQSLPLAWRGEPRQGVSQNIDAEVSSWIPLAPARKGFEDLLAVRCDVAFVEGAFALVALLPTPPLRRVVLVEGCHLGAAGAAFIQRVGQQQFRG